MKATNSFYEQAKSGQVEIRNFFLEEGEIKQGEIIKLFRNLPPVEE